MFVLYCQDGDLRKELLFSLYLLCVVFVEHKSRTDGLLPGQAGMLHQLHMMSVSEPRQELLKNLASSEESLPEILSRLASFHMASQEVFQPLREVTVCANEHYFPHPQDIPALILFFFQKLGRFWSYCECEEDDLFVAAFAVYGILAIHPFENGNGRTSLDFAQYLLMKRWGLSSPPFTLERGIHREIAGVLAVLDQVNEGKTPEEFYALRLRLAQRLDQMTLNRLKASKPFQIVASFFQQALTSEEIFLQMDE